MKTLLASKISVFAGGSEGLLARINLSIHFSSTDCQINSSGMPINPPNFAPNATDREKKKVCSVILKIIIKIGELLNIEELKFKIPSSSHGYNNSKLSYWHFLLLKNGCTTEFRNSLVINLNENLIEIKQRFRKRYKSYINKALRTWSYKNL